MTPELILSALLALTPHRTDAALTAAERSVLLAPVAVAISEAARTPREAALLIAYGWEDTKFAALVIAGRCSEMPGGEHCDHGRARGPFSLHRAACPAAYVLPAGSLESLRVEASCAMRLLRWHAARGRDHTLTPEHAAFAGMAAANSGWHWGGADARVETFRIVLGRMNGG